MGKPDTGDDELLECFKWGWNWRKRAKELEAALEHYGEHTPKLCRVALGADGPCNCGLDEIFTKAEK